MSRLLALSLLAVASWLAVRAPRSPAQQPPVKAEVAKGKKIAVLVGVNEYLNKPLENLRFAEQDMLSLKAKLEAAGFAVVLLLGSEAGKLPTDEELAKDGRALVRKPFEASRENLVATLIDKREENKRFAFRDVASEDDQIVVAFSGHGQQIPVEEADDDGKGVKREVPFFCPKRAESGKPSTQVSLNDVLKTFHGGKAKALLLVDACRDFAANVEGTKGAVVDRKRIDALRPNVAGMFACSDRQRAIEHPNPAQVTDAAKAEGHGLFFYSVLEAMGHKNARDRDGNVDWDRMVGEIKDTVADKSKALFPTMLDTDRQLPQGFGSFTRKFVLATAATAPPKPKENPVASPGGAVVADTPVVDPPSGPAPALLAKWPFATEDAKKAQEAWAKHLGVKVREEVRLSAKAKLTLVLIPPGTFTMGSPKGNEAARGDEKPERKVTISKPFFLGLTEVTQDEYEAVAKIKKGTFDGIKDNNASAAKNPDLKHGLLPVEDVDVRQAETYCEAIGELLRKRDKPWKAATGLLPTEAQFEWACRAGTDTDPDATQLPRIANVKVVAKGMRSLDRTDTCRERIANAFGLFDMHGNVAEWCRDRYDPEFYKNAPDPDTDPFQGRTAFTDRVVRGGSWMSTAKDSRSAARRPVNPESRSDEIGFRVLVTIAP